MQTEKRSQPRPLSAVLKKEFDPDYCRGNATFTNGTSETITLQPGVLLTGTDRSAVFDTAAVATVTGICITAIQIRVGESHPIGYLDAGPGILVRDGLELPADAAQATAIEATLTGKGWNIEDGVPS